MTIGNSDTSSNDDADQSASQDLASIYEAIDQAIDESDLEPSGKNDQIDKDQESDKSKKSDDQDDADKKNDDEDDDKDDDDVSSEDGKKDDKQGKNPEKLSSAEKKAREKGWKPKSEFDGDDDDWISAGEFNRRTELFDKIGSQNKTIKSLNKKLDALIAHNKNLEKSTREKVVAELEAKRKEAVKYGDEEAFDEAETELKKVKQDKSALDDDKDDSDDRKNEQQIEIPRPIRDFADRNSDWFEKDQEMTDFVVFKVQSLVNNKKLSIDDALEQAEKEVKKIYPSKFENPNKKRASSAMSGSGQSRPEKVSMSKLTKEQKQVWHTLKGVMTEKEFLEQLENVG